MCFECLLICLFLIGAPRYCLEGIWLCLGIVGVLFLFRLNRILRLVALPLGNFGEIFALLAFLCTGLSAGCICRLASFGGYLSLFGKDLWVFGSLLRNYSLFNDHEYS